MSATDRDLTAQYIAARKDSRRDNATLAERAAAQNLSAKIATQAHNLGSPLDEIALDEQARAELYPVAPARERVIGRTATGLPIYG